MESPVYSRPLLRWGLVPKKDLPTLGAALTPGLTACCLLGVDGWPGKRKPDGMV